MTNRLKWTRTGVTALLAVSLLGIPSIASARDRCDNGSRGRQAYSRGVYGSDRGTGYRAAAYGNEAYRNRAYRNDAYRNEAYRNSAYRNRNYGYQDSDYGDYRETRSTAKSAAIIGGGDAAGAAVGALAGGGKGALIGAAVGGVGGLIYDRTTRNKGDRW